MNLHSNGLFCFWTASGSIDHPRMACFAFLARSKTAKPLILGATIILLGALRIEMHNARFRGRFGRCSLKGPANGGLDSFDIQCLTFCMQCEVEDVY
jgi:hypothetical protein